MAEITGITPQVKDKTRCNIEIDGRFYCGLKLETVMQYRVKIGMEVSPEELSAMQLQSEKQTALDKALKSISASMKTEREVRAFLAGKGFLPEVCDYAVDKMKGYGYLDDAAYAAAYLESAGKRKGKRLIAAELRQKGIAPEIIEEALSSFEGEAESAKGVLEKYMRGKTADRKTLQKAFAHLLGRGFDGETAREALGTLSDLNDED